MQTYFQTVLILRLVSTYLKELYVFCLLSKNSYKKNIFTCPSGLFSGSILSLGTHPLLTNILCLKVTFINVKNSILK